MSSTKISYENALVHNDVHQRTLTASLPLRWVIFLFIVGVVALTISVLTLTTVPAIHTDEAWYADLAYNWLTTGDRWTTLDAGPFPGGRGQSTTLLGALPTRVGIQIWGLSQQAIRLPSLLAGVAMLGVIAGIGSLIWSGRSAALATLVLLTQPLFLYGSHLARPEVWLSLVVTLALGCSILGWKRDQPRWDVLAALLVVLSVEIHQNGAVFAVGLGASYVARYGRQVLRRRNGLGFFAITAPGALVYLYRSSGWLALTGRGNGVSVLGSASSHSIPLFSGNPIEWILNELVRYLLYFGNEPLSALLLGLGIMAALRRRGDADNVLLVWLLGSAIAMMLLVSHKLETYLLPMLGAGALLVGRMLADLLLDRHLWGREATVLLFAVLCLPLLFTLGEHGTGQTTQLQQELQQSVPCERILGPNQYWLAFPECDYRSWDVVSHYHHNQGASFDSAMDAIHPDYILVDNSIVGKLGPDFEAGGNTGSYYTLPELDFQRFLAERATPVRWIAGSDQDTIQIFAVHWGAEPHASTDAQQ